MNSELCSLSPSAEVYAELLLRASFMLFTDISSNVSKREEMGLVEMMKAFEVVNNLVLHIVQKNHNNNEHKRTYNKQIN